MKKIFPLLCLVLLSGCSWMKFWDKDSGGEEVEIEPAELVKFEPTVKLDKLWSNGGVGELLPGIGHLQPALGNNTLFVADSEGRVLAVNAGNGKKLWSKELDVQLSGGVGFGGGQVLVGSIEGSVYALSSEDGSLLWKAKASTEVLSAPASNGSVSLVQTPDGRLVAFDANTGARLWSFEVDVPVLTIRGTSAPIATDTMAVGAFSNGKVYGLNAQNGTVLWEARLAIPRGRTELERIVDVDGNLLLQDDVIYAASFQGRLGALTRGSGRMLWNKDVSSYRTPGYSFSQVYISDENDVVRAYRSNSGQELWSNDQMQYRRLTGPVPLGDYVAVADQEGYLHLLSQVDGSFAARVKVDGSGVSAEMIAADGKLYVLDNDGGITAYKIK